VAGKDALLLFELAICILIKLNDFCTLFLDLGRHSIDEHVPPDLVMRLHLRFLCLSLCFSLRLELSAVLESHCKHLFAVFNQFASAS